MLLVAELVLWFLISKAFYRWNVESWIWSIFHQCLFLVSFTLSRSVALEDKRAGSATKLRQLALPLNWRFRTCPNRPPPLIPFRRIFRQFVDRRLRWFRGRSADYYHYCISEITSLGNNRLTSWCAPFGFQRSLPVIRLSDFTYLPLLLFSVKQQFFAESTNSRFHFSDFASPSPNCLVVFFN